MNRRVDKLIPKAIKAAKTHIADNKEILKKYNGAIPSEYNGYISSFGAAVLQSGLKAAVAFSESASSGSEKDKKPLMRAILSLVKNDHDHNNDNDEKSLLEYVLNNDTLDTQNKIMEATTALKLAVRTFELKKGDEQDE